MPRYIKFRNSFSCTGIVKFDDEYSDWCDYYLANSKMTHEITQAEADSEPEPNYYDDLHGSFEVFPNTTSFWLSSATGRLKTMLSALLNGNSCFITCVEAGLSPSDTYKIKQLVRKVRDEISYACADAITRMPYPDIKITRDNLDKLERVHTAFDRGQQYRDFDAWFDPDVVIEIVELPNQYINMLVAAGEAGLDFDWVIEVGSEAWDSAYAEWQDGGHIEDIFA